MFEGRLLAIAITPKGGGEMKTVDRARLVPGKGIEGDRYSVRAGTFSKPGEPDAEVTLIEMEAIEAIARDQKIVIEPRQARRNLVTRGVPLNHLVGRRFSIGDAVLEGQKLSEPCKHLETLTAAGIKDALLHRGGLEARIVKDGVLRPGDPIRPLDVLGAAAGPAA